MTEDNLQGRLLWCDAEANCSRMADSAGVADIAAKAAKANVNTLIVDVKPLGGEALYKSDLAPRLGEVEGFIYPKEFDLLKAMVEECHSRGLKVHAAINVFAEGHRQWGRGPAYQHPEWQATMCEGTWDIKFSGGACITAEYLDPWDPVDEPTIYTMKSGARRHCDAGNVCVVIQEGRVVQVVHEQTVEISVPADGCVLSLPSDSAVIAPDETVAFRCNPVFRLAQDSKVSTFGIFVNPIGPAREYELKIIEEIVSKYDVDAITFDRMRYPNLYADFSELSRTAFEEWLGQGALNWPTDIFVMNDHPWKPPTPGKHYKKWLEWRAWQIHDFADEAVALVRRIKPATKVGVYVGSWYESYYDVGVNWARPSFRPGYDWMTPEYHRTGYAEMFDYICTGCYYPHATRADARSAGRSEGASVEAACGMSIKAVDGATPIYASLYLRDYADKLDAFRKAVQVALLETNGVMLFDLVYLEKYGWWDALKEEMPGAAMSPHNVAP